MTPVTARMLHRKGWGKQEIARAQYILQKEFPHTVPFSRIVFWTALVITIIGNMLVAIGLIPFLVVLPALHLYVVVAILAGVVGFLYTHVITDIGHLEKKHHLMAAIVLPVIGFMNAVFMTLVANQIILDLPFVKNPGHNPGMIGLVFAVAFMLPYVMKRILRK